MSKNINRDWLQSYKNNPKTDNIIYKDYQNPSMSKWETQFSSLSNAQRQQYNQLINNIPDEIKGLSAIEMNKYLKGVDDKQNILNTKKNEYVQKTNILKNTQQIAEDARRKQAEIVNNESWERSFEEAKRKQAEINAARWNTKHIEPNRRQIATNAQLKQERDAKILDYYNKIKPSYDAFMRLNPYPPVSNPDLLRWQKIMNEMPGGYSKDLEEKYGMTQMWGKK